MYRKVDTLYLFRNSVVSKHVFHFRELSKINCILSLSIEHQRNISKELAMKNRATVVAGFSTQTQNDTYLSQWIQRCSPKLLHILHYYLQCRWTCMQCSCRSVRTSCRTNTEIQFVIQRTSNPETNLAVDPWPCFFRTKKLIRVNISFANFVGLLRLYRRWTSTRITLTDWNETKFK